MGLLPSDVTISIETKKDSQDNLDDFINDVVFFRNIRNTNKQIIIRKVRQSDIMSVFNLNNSPDVRMRSIATDKIELENHKIWFQRKLESHENLFYIVETAAGDFVGQVRFDLQDSGRWLISISIDKNFRAKGLGAWAIIKASKMAQIVRDFTVVAYIKKDNESSKRAFIKAGFVFTGQETIKETLLDRLELQPIAKRVEPEISQ